MKFWILYVLLLAFSTGGNALADESVHPAKRVLIVNLIGPELTQSHLGITAFSTSERKIQNDWAIDVYAGDVLSSLLAGAGYESVPGSIEGRPERVLKNPMTSWSGKPAFQHEFAAWLQGAMTETNAAHAVVLQTYGRAWGPSTYAEYSGYGIGSTMGESPKHVWVYANVRALVVTDANSKPLASTRLRDSDCRVAIDVVTLPDGHFNQWTAEALKPYEATLRAVVERRLRQDLASAGLTNEFVEPCRVTTI